MSPVGPRTSPSHGGPASSLVLQQVQTPGASVRDLVSSTFGVTDLPNDVRHFALVRDQQVIGYCASRTIVIRLAGDEGPWDHLGLVCVGPKWRGQGHGKALLTEFLQNRRSSGSLGALLNCGPSVEAFYGKCGFRRVAHQASYLRHGQTVIDDDPVLAFFYGPGPGPLTPEDRIHLGKDL